MYILYATLSTTFLNTYVWELENIGLAYLGIAVGALFGMSAAAKVSDAFMITRKGTGDERPGSRLLSTSFFWPILSVELLMYAWSAQKAVNWAVPMLGTSIFGAGAMSTIVSVRPYIRSKNGADIEQFLTETYIIDTSPTYSASGTAAGILLRSILGGLAPLFPNKMRQQLGVGWIFSTLAVVALPVASLPWIAYRYGEMWRKAERLGADYAKYEEREKHRGVRRRMHMAGASCRLLRERTVRERAISFWAVFVKEWFFFRSACLAKVLPGNHIGTNDHIHRLCYACAQQGVILVVLDVTALT